MKFTRIIFCILSFFVTAPAMAATSPLAISIFPPVQFPSSEFTTSGLRLSVLYGNHKDLYGLDLGGIGNITEHGFGGIGISGVFNITRGQTSGMQIAGLFNENRMTSKLYGLQIAAILNENQAASSLLGFQVAAVNLSKFTNIMGAQIGLFNQALNVDGFQIGLLNMTTNLHGMQIGLLNFYEKGLFIVSPIINIGFN